MGVGQASSPQTPNGGRFYGLSTDFVPARERFDFWASLFPRVKMAPLPRIGGPYGARGTGCAGDDGVMFNDLACVPTAASYSDGDNDHMRLTLIVAGAVHVVQGRDERIAAQPGPGLHLFDSARAVQVDSPTGYRAVHLTLPRAMVHQAMGRDPMAGQGSYRALPDTPLSLLLKSQMQAFARHGPQMSADESAAVMESLSSLARTYLRRFNKSLQEAVESPEDETLFAAASSYVDTWKEDPGLTAAAVAVAIGCSRARLYRLFDRRGLAVAEHIRQARLNHSRALLRDPALDIGDIALRCGYGDISAFGKAFRRRFGMSPRTWRATIA